MAIVLTRIVAVVAALLIVYVGGDTIIKDNPAQFSAVTTDGNGRRIPVAGEMDTIQVFDIHPADADYKDPGLRIDIDVSPLNATNGLPDDEQHQSTVKLAPPPAAAVNPAHGYAAADDGKAADNVDYPYTAQNPRDETMSGQFAPNAANQTLAANANAHAGATTYRQPNSAGVAAHPNTGARNDDLPFNPSSTGSTASDAAAPSSNKAFVPIVAGQNPFAGAANPFKGAFNEAATPQQPWNPFGGGTGATNWVAGYPTTINPFAPTANSLNAFGATRTPSDNNGSSANTLQTAANPFASFFGQNKNPFSPFSAANPWFNSSSADTNANPPRNTLPANGGPLFNPFAPTSPQNLFPLGGSTTYNAKNSFSPTTAFAATPTSNSFFAPYGGAAAHSLFGGGKPPRVGGPNAAADDRNGGAVGTAAASHDDNDDYKDDAKSGETTEKSGSLMNRLLNWFAPKNVSTPVHPLPDYDDQTASDSGSASSSSLDEPVDAPSPFDRRPQTDYINPLIYKSYFDPTDWNRFTNITNFDGDDNDDDQPNSLGNAHNPFGAFSPSSSPFAFMRHVNPWSPGNVNNPWNRMNINDALLNLTSFVKQSLPAKGVNFRLPGADSGAPWTYNTSAPDQLEIFRGGPLKFNASSPLRVVNASLLPPPSSAYAPAASGYAWPKLNLSAANAARNVSQLMNIVRDTIEMLTGNSSGQAEMLKSLTGGAFPARFANAMNANLRTGAAPATFESVPAAAYRRRMTTNLDDGVRSAADGGGGERNANDDDSNASAGQQHSLVQRWSPLVAALPFEGDDNFAALDRPHNSTAADEKMPSPAALRVNSAADDGGSARNAPSNVTGNSARPSVAAADVDTPFSGGGPKSRVESRRHRQSAPKPTFEIEDVPDDDAKNDAYDAFAENPVSVVEYVDNGVSANGTADHSNGTSSEAPPNAAIVILSSWMVVIGFVVGIVAQKMFA